MFSTQLILSVKGFFLNVKGANEEDLHYECDLKITDFKITGAFGQLLFERSFKYEEQCRSLIARALPTN